MGAPGAGGNASGLLFAELFAQLLAQGTLSTARFYIEVLYTLPGASLTL